MPGNPEIVWNPELRDVSRGPAVVTLVIITSIFMILTTALRVGFRLYGNRRITLDNCFIVLAVAINMVGNAFEIKAVSEGFGRHLQFLSVEASLEVRKWTEIGILFGGLALWACKLSISFFVLAIIHDTHQRTRRFTLFLMITTSLAGIVEVTLWSLQARPLEKLWKPDVPGTVAPIHQIYASILAVNATIVITDLFYALSPIYFVGGLQMSWKRKLIFLVLTGTGLLVFAVSMVKSAFAHSLFDKDFTWALEPFYFCSILERNLSVTVANLPCIYPFFRTVHRKAVVMIKSTTSSSKSSMNSEDKSSHGHPRTIGSISNNSKPGGLDSINNDFPEYGKSLDNFGIHDLGERAPPLPNGPGRV